MRIFYLKPFFVAYLLLYSFISISQNAWTQKSPFPGGARAYTSAFTIGHYAFVGIGNNGNYLHDFWKWDETTNLWSAIPNYPGAGTYCSTAFTIEGKGYVGLGWTGSKGTNDFWRFDTISNTWTQMATFPGVGRYDCEAFVIGHKAYLIAGSISGPPYLQDVWEYDAHTNTWTQKANWPGGKVEQVISFAIGNHGYIGDGWYPGCNVQMFEYDTTFDSWTSISPPPPAIGITEQPDTWVFGSKAYVCTGANCNAAGLRNGWMYDTITKSWCEFNYIAASNLSRGNGVAFTIGNHGYFCTGQDTNLHDLGDLWEYTPSTKINVQDTVGTCAGDSVYFSSSTTYIASAWNWSFPGGSPATSNLQNPIVYYSNSGTYTATLLLSTCGGDDTVSRTITVTTGALGGIKTIGKSPICIGTPDTLSISGGTGYIWSNGATTSTIIVKPHSNTIYTISVTNNNCQKDTTIKITVTPYPSISISGNDTICSGSSTTITASGGNSYLWNTGATTNSISLSPVSNTTYTVEVSNGSCSTDTTANIVVNPSPSVVVGSPSYTICLGDSIALGVSGANSYTWIPPAGLSCVNCSNPIATPTISTTYTVTGSNKYGCTDQKTISIVIATPPILAAIPNQTICSGNQITLTAHAISGIGTYSWQPGGSTSASITVSPNATTTYTVQYTNACGSKSNNVTVFVAQAPVTNFIADNTSGCAPLCIQFRDLTKVANGNIAQWRWQFGDGDTLDEQNPIYCYPDTGSFTTTLTTVSNDGCSSTLKIVKMISVYSKPNASFFYVPQPVTILEPTVQFTDNSGDIYGIAFRWWSFGDGQSLSPQTSIINPVHTYQDTGIYCPQLVIENNKGCIDTVTNCLFVSPLYTLYIPSAFSPNVDGLNDVFAAKGSYIKSFEMYVFDRWGMELFHSTDINKGWDGTVHGNGVISQEDSYVYIITATDWNMTQHTYTGEVTLLK